MRTRPAPGYVTLSGSGQAFGLEHVSYRIATGTIAGPIAVSVVLGNNTEILDVNANKLAFSATNGAITVTPFVVPEPPSIVAWAIALATLSPIIIGQIRSGRRRSDPLPGETGR